MIISFSKLEKIFVFFFNLINYLKFKILKVSIIRSHTEDLVYCENRMVVENVSNHSQMTS